MPKVCAKWYLPYSKSLIIFTNFCINRKLRNFDPTIFWLANGG